MSDTAANGQPDAGLDPNDRPCDQCGHIWFAGERQHQFAGGSAVGNGEIEVLCSVCSHKRLIAPPPEE